MVFALSMTGCGGGEQEPVVPEKDAQEEAAPVDKAPSGIQDDGIGDDPTFGEGIGEVIALSDEEKAYMLAQTTDTWLEMSRQEKDELVVLIGRWMEEITGFIVEDYDDMVVVLDRQMEQYDKNGVNESVVRTAGDIYNVALPLEDPNLPGDEIPSGINDDGMGDDPTFGEGIGEVLALTPEEESYMLTQTTNTWLKMDQEEKVDLVALVGRSLEETYGFIVEDYDDLVVMLDRQMEQYYKNGVDESVLATACDIYGLG